MFWRASSLAPGATESSRSMNTSSAGSPGALDSIFGEEPGTDRHERLGLVTRVVMIRSFRRVAVQAMLVPPIRLRHDPGARVTRGALGPCPPSPERKAPELPAVGVVVRGEEQ